MEAFEECPINDSSLYTKPNILEESDIVASDSGDRHQTNGVDIANTENGTQPNDVTDVMESEQVGNEACKEEINDDAESKLEVEPLHETAGLEPTSENLCVPEEQVVVVTNVQNQNEDVVCEVVTEVTIDGVEHDSTDVVCEGKVSEPKVEEEKKTESDSLELSQNEVQFQTEILVEKNDNDVNENILVESKPEAETIILSELDHNIELSEVLQSDIADSNDTHSGAIRQEVFNKEELLDILQGNDGEQASIEEEMEDEENKKKLEAQIALKQLSRLSTKIRSSPKKTRGEGRKPLTFKKRSNTDTNTNKKQEKDMGKQVTAEKETDVDIKIQEKNSAQQLTVEKTDTPKEDTRTTEEEETEPKKENDKISERENIVSSLVMDWDDDEPIESKELDTSKASKISEISTEDNVVEVGEQSEESQDPPTEETVSKPDNSQNTDKTGDDEPPRRISRVIKKKVIFDPDNPDTFTKGKTPLKNKDSAEPTPPKKPKPEQTRQRSKSPVSKQQWKKPSPKNSKQCRRLTEVDKLLMDEGAVNMLYQLTPDAPKGKKNMKTKAEIIKKLQSSTPEAKEKGRFRERKKEIIKYEDGEAKKIISGKLRASLNACVKSPSVSEDFETHSADDSIIYRRHSSSSYSSSCMSPRRLSDVETGSVQNTTQKVKENTAANLEETVQQVSESFMAESEANLSSKEIDCLSIKEKLNSKLSQALNKRKRDNTKNDKPIKQKKLSKDDIPDISGDQFKFVSIVTENKLATVCVKKTAVKIGIEVIKELEEALLYLDKHKDTSVTLLSSECVVLCSSLDLNFLLEENKETRVKQAYTLADSIRLLLCSAAQHSKLLCCSVWGACCGVGLALATFCDVVLASECATFALAMGSAPLFPGTAALTVRCQALPQALINDLVVFGRRISSGEALRSGLISRTLWPDRFQEQVDNIVRDIATQPQPTILLKKKLLNLRNSAEEARLSSCLKAERDLLVEYWTSVEGQELLRATLDCA